MWLKLDSCYLLPKAVLVQAIHVENIRKFLSTVLFEIEYLVTICSKAIVYS